MTMRVACHLLSNAFLTSVHVWVVGSHVHACSSLVTFFHLSVLWVHTGGLAYICFSLHWS